MTISLNIILRQMLQNMNISTTSLHFIMMNKLFYSTLITQYFTCLVRISLTTKIFGHGLIWDSVQRWSLWHTGRYWCPRAAGGKETGDLDVVAAGSVRVYHTLHPQKCRLGRGRGWRDWPTHEDWRLVGVGSGSWHCCTLWGVERTGTWLCGQPLLCLWTMNHDEKYSLGLFVKKTRMYYNILITFCSYEPRTITLLNN